MPLVARYAGPYAWQENNSTRRFEYPWAAEQIANLRAAAGRPLTVVDVGGSTAGIQFTLARLGHRVHNVDPGLGAEGRGWRLDGGFHRYLTKVYRAPVSLHESTLAGARFEDRSVDVVLSLSAIEHFGARDLDEFVAETRRILAPGGHVVLTIDLFLDLRPFTDTETNVFGKNVDVARIVDSLDAELVVGQRSDLFGFPEFDARRVQARLADLMVGDPYPALAQCLVARVR